MKIIKTEFMIRNKNKKRKVIFMLILSLMSGSHLIAQHPPPRHGPPPIPGEKYIRKILSDLNSELSLTKEQESQISKLYINHFEELKKSMSIKMIPKEEMEQREKILEEEVKAMLTKKQKKVYKAFLRKQNKERDKLEARGGGHRPPGPMPR